MFDSQPTDPSTMVSTKTSDGGIKRDVEGQGSTTKIVKNEFIQLWSMVHL